MILRITFSMSSFSVFIGHYLYQILLFEANSFDSTGSLYLPYLRPSWFDSQRLWAYKKFLKFLCLLRIYGMLFFFWNGIVFNYQAKHIAEEARPYLTFQIRNVSLMINFQSSSPSLRLPFQNFFLKLYRYILFSRGIITITEIMS